MEGIVGGFHIALTFLAVLGKRFGDVGLRDLLVELRVLGPESSNSFVKQYSGCVGSSLKKCTIVVKRASI